MTERYSLAPEGSKPRPEELDEDVVDYYQYSAARGDAAAQVCVSLCLCLCLGLVLGVGLWCVCVCVVTHTHTCCACGAREL